MSAVNKIHLNSTTRISLNERFTFMQSAAAAEPVQRGRRVNSRSRSRSQSFGRTMPVTIHKTPIGSFSNRRLVDQLEQKHKIRAALKLKNRSIRSGRQKLPRNSNRVQLKRVANALNVSGTRRINRSNSLSNIATMTADIVQRQRSLKRSNSSTSVASRLGFRKNGVGGNNQPQVRRRLNRSNSLSNVRPNNARGNIQNRLNRNNSRTNTNRINNRNGIQQQRKPLNRGNLRRGSGLTSISNRGNARGRGNLKRTNSNANLSINNRLGAVRNTQPSTRARTVRGRVFKRTPNQRNVKQNNARGNPSIPRVGRPLKRGGQTAVRGGQTAARGRSRSRSRNPNGKQGANVRNRNNSRSRVARGRGRGNANNRGRRGRSAGRLPNPGPTDQVKTKSKEELDQELEVYMANTKTCLDREMDEYMNGI